MSGSKEVFGAAPERGAAAPGAPLTCHNSIFSDESLNKDKFKSLDSHQRKVIFAIEQNIQGMVETFGEDRLGFLTLTFADKVQDMKEAQRRFNNLAGGVLRKRYNGWIVVPERHKSGVIHFHVLVASQYDLRSGVCFDQFLRGDFRSAPNGLRAEWAFWRGKGKGKSVMARYGFGNWFQMWPVMHSGKAIARYIGGYVAKGQSHRRPEDKGAKLVRYGKGVGKVGTRFSWNSARSSLWRAKLMRIAAAMGAIRKVAGEKVDGASFRRWWGPRWAYYLKRVVGFVKLPVYATGTMYNIDYNEDCFPPGIVDVFSVSEWGNSHYDDLWWLGAVVESLMKGVLPSVGYECAD